MMNELTITPEQIKAAEDEFVEKLKIYREVALDNNKTKDDLKEAANTVIKAIGKCLDLRTKSQNEVVMLSQALSEYILNPDKKPNKVN